jgi:hypothetical protein
VAAAHQGAGKGDHGKPGGRRFERSVAARPADAVEIDVAGPEERRELGRRDARGEDDVALRREAGGGERTVEPRLESRRRPLFRLERDDFRLQRILRF